MIQKIISAIMALIMSVFSFILPPVEIDVLNISGEVISTGSGSRANVNTPVICRNYKQFEMFCKSSNSTELTEYLAEIDKELFENYCIVAVNFAVADPSYKVYITSAECDGKTLELDYVYANYRVLFTPCVVSYETLVLVVNKRIKNVELNKGDSESFDFFPRDAMFGCKIISTDPVSPYYPENEGCFEGYFIFEDYESWADFRDNGNWKMENTEAYIEEAFFENNNLVVAITTHASSGYSLYYSDCTKDGSNAKIKFYSAYEPGVHMGAIFYEAALVAVSKDVKTADVEYEFINLPFRVDGKFAFEIVC